VISVGNLSVGGSGKTPAVEYIAKLLVASGERPAILTRGYARRVAADGVTVVSDGVRILADLDLAGDEPLMLARALPGVPVLVGADRYLSGRLAERRLGATVHLLDDGFQHLELARDVDLLLVGEDDLADRPLPGGRLREPLAGASAADALLAMVDDDAAADRLRRALGAPLVFRVSRALGGPRWITPGQSGVVPTRDPVFAVAGIARPQRFFDDVAKAGWRVAGTLEFGDHHRFAQKDVDRIAKAARAQSSAVVLTTEKDAVRFAALDLDGLPIAAVPLQVTIEPPEFDDWLLERVRARRLERPASDSPQPSEPVRMRHRFEYLLVKTLRALVRAMPWALVDGCGTLLGLGFYAFDRAHRRVADRNVAAAFPARPATEQRTIVRGAFAHFGHLLFELLKFSTLSPEAMLARVEFEGDERARLAYARGKGVLFVTGHFGFWELQAMVHALQLQPMAVVARTLDNRALNALLEQIRQRTGNTVIYRRGTIRRVMRLLHAGQGVGVLIDQHIQSRDAIYVDFFGRPAATTSVVAALALRTGARVVPLFALPLGGGRYRMVYEPPVEPPSSDAADAIHEFTQRCTDVLEMYVRRNPELWLWMHRRWRDSSQPGEPERNMFPATEPDTTSDEL